MRGWVVGGTWQNAQLSVHAMVYQGLADSDILCHRSTLGAPCQLLEFVPNPA